jgi:hypothetical protein
MVGLQLGHGFGARGSVGHHLYRIAGASGRCCPKPPGRGKLLRPSTATGARRDGPALPALRGGLGRRLLRGAGSPGQRLRRRRRARRARPRAPGSGKPHDAPRGVYALRDPARTRSAAGELLLLLLLQRNHPASSRGRGPAHGAACGAAATATRCFDSAVQLLLRVLRMVLRQRLSGQIRGAWEERGPQ